MKKIFVLFLGLVLVLSCHTKDGIVATKNNDSIKVDTAVKKEFEMYTMSEMAGLMEQMYVQNLSVKEKIATGRSIGAFPDYYLKIHSAKFTDATDNDFFFKANATAYIDSQKTLYSSDTDLKKNYNAGIDACIKCHEKKCGGPIPKIKKLYLK